MEGGGRAGAEDGEGAGGGAEAAGRECRRRPGSPPARGGHVSGSFLCLLQKAISRKRFELAPKAVLSGTWLSAAQTTPSLVTRYETVDPPRLQPCCPSAGRLRACPPPSGWRPPCPWPSPRPHVSPAACSQPSPSGTRCLLGWQVEGAEGIPVKKAVCWLLELLLLELGSAGSSGILHKLSFRWRGWQWEL